MVATFVKAFGAVVVGTPVAVLLGLTARSIRKQEDAAVPVIRREEAPLRVDLYSSYLDRRTHEYLSPKSMKKGYVAYDLRVENLTSTAVRSVHLELLDADDDIVGTVRLGDLEAHGHTVVAVKKGWNAALEQARVRGTGHARAVLTWKSPEGRRRAVVPLQASRALGVNPAETKRLSRAKKPVVQRVMS